MAAIIWTGNSSSTPGPRTISPRTRTSHSILLFPPQKPGVTSVGKGTSFSPARISDRSIVSNNGMRLKRLLSVRVSVPCR
jgi:hypothetical protein